MHDITATPSNTAQPQGNNNKNHEKGSLHSTTVCVMFGATKTTVVRASRPSDNVLSSFPTLLSPSARRTGLPPCLDLGTATTAAVAKEGITQTQERADGAKTCCVIRRASTTAVPPSVLHVCTDTHQRLADPQTLGFEEGEDHTAPEKDDVALFDQRLDHRDLPPPRTKKTKGKARQGKGDMCGSRGGVGVCGRCRCVLNKQKKRVGRVKMSDQREPTLFWRQPSPLPSLPPPPRQKQKNNPWYNNNKKMDPPPAGKREKKKKSQRSSTTSNSTRSYDEVRISGGLQSKKRERER